MVPEQADQVQATEAGGGGTRESAEEEGKPPHQQMAHRHQAVQLRGHRRDLRGLKPVRPLTILPETLHLLLMHQRTNIIYYVIILSIIRHIGGRHKNSSLHQGAVL